MVVIHYHESLKISYSLKTDDFLLNCTNQVKD